MAPDSSSKLVTYRVTFEGSDRVERIRAEAYKSVPPYVEFVVTESEGLESGDNPHHDHGIGAAPGRR